MISILTFLGKKSLTTQAPFLLWYELFSGEFGRRFFSRYRTLSILRL
jgi:hypothetical protein